MRRVLHLLLAALLVALSVASFSASAAPRCGVKEGVWRVLRAPIMKGGSAMSGLAVDPIGPNRMFATNGTEVMKSDNGGCDWKKALDITEMPAFRSPAGGATRIKEFGMSERGARRTYLLVEEQTAVVTRPHVVISNNGGGSWQVSDAGLPPAGRPVLLRVAPSSPDVAYLVVDVAGAAVVVFATTDGGTTWQFRSRLDTPAVNDLKIDPLKPDDIWVGAANGLFHSSDGGNNFESIDQFAAGPGVNVQLLDVFSEGGPARVLAFIPGDSQITLNGGRTWAVVGVPATARSVAHGQSSSEIVMSTATDVYAFAPTIQTWVDMYAPLSGVRGLQGDRAGRTEFYGFTDHAIVIYEAPVLQIKIPKDVIEIPDISLIDAAPADIALPSSLTPGRSSVRIPAGDDKEVTYDLKVPRTLTPLDVMFVVDTSSSMTQVIHEAADALEDIHNGLVASGAAVEFGLVEYRSYPTDIPPREPPGDVTDNYVYQRVLDVGATAPEMEQGIEALVAAGGGIYDAQLEALWQLATGSGKDVWPPGPSVRDVPRGLQANFRSKALRVVLHVGDEPFGKEEGNSDADNPTRPEGEVAKPDIPEFEAVAAALNQNNIKHLGLSLYPDATPDLRKMARATNSFAPTGGVDCDRNGSIDVAAGDPLVCVLRQDEITDANMTPAIVELVEAIRTKSNVGLQTSGAGASLVRSVSPDSYSSVLLQADNSLDFDVTYHCPRSRAGDKAKVELRVSGLIGTPPDAETTVICGEIEKDEEPFLQPTAQVLAFIPLLPLAPPPPPINISSATQAQAQAQANAAFAAQEQEQPQVAMVHQLHAEAKEALAREERYSFATLKQEEVSPVPLYAAAALLSMAFGTAMVMRNRIRIRLRYLK